MTRIERFAARRVRVMSLNPAVEPTVWVARGSLAAGMCAESPEGANQAGCVRVFTIYLAACSCSLDFRRESPLAE